MLKLSTRGRYGLRAMIELARSFNAGPVMMSAITERQDISRKYLHALLTSLKNAGLVKAVRGAKGGFMLTRRPEDIQVIEICEALEGNLAIVDCVTDTSICNRVGKCETRGLWVRLHDQMLAVLSGTSLSELVDPEFPSMLAGDGGICAPSHHSRQTAS